MGSSRRRFYARVAVVLGIVLPLTGTGCSWVKEEHYLALIDSSNALKHPDSVKPINYFKLTIKGWSTLSSVRYVSGYFDPSAVDTYFGTFKQPADGLIGSTQPGQTVAELKDGQVQFHGNKRFVMMLSTNADAIADALGALAQNSAIAKDVVRLANRDTYTDRQEAMVAAATGGGSGDVVVAEGGTLLGGLTDATPADAVERSMVTLANRLSGLTDSPKTVSTLSELTVTP